MENFYENFYNFAIYEHLTSDFSEIDILHSRYFVPEQVVAALKEALSSDYRNRCQTINDFIEFIEILDEFPQFE